MFIKPKFKLGDIVDIDFEWGDIKNAMVYKINYNVVSGEVFYHLVHNDNASYYLPKAYAGKIYGNFPGCSDFTIGESYLSFPKSVRRQMLIEDILADG
jgi:hypothetical protein